VPVAVDDLPLPGLEAEAIDAVAGPVVTDEQRPDDGPGLVPRAGPPARADQLEVPTDHSRVMEARIRRPTAPGRVYPGERHADQVLVEDRQLPPRLARSLRRAIAARAIHEPEEFVDVVFETQRGHVVIDGRQQGCHGEGPLGQVLLDRLGESDAGQVVPAAGPALEQKRPFLRRHHDLRRPPIPARQRRHPVHHPDIVVAQHLHQLFRRKMCSTSDHTFIISTQSPNEIPANHEERIRREEFAPPIPGDEGRLLALDLCRTLPYRL